MNDDEPQEPRRKPYTMSEAALEQRRAAAEKSTGPRTEEGKAIVSRNAWKHGLRSAVMRAPEWQRIGMLMKPCVTTCARYPCELVTTERTRAGGDCLDKTVYVEAFDAIISALHSGNAEHGYGMLAAQLAQAIDMLQSLRTKIAEDGFVVEVPMVDKNGARIGERYEPHPVLPHYIKMLDTLGINFAELMMTPRAQTQAKEKEEEKDAFATLMGGLMGRAGGPVKRRTIEGEFDDED